MHEKYAEPCTTPTGFSCDKMNMHTLTLTFVLIDTLHIFYTQIGILSFILWKFNKIERTNWKKQNDDVWI